MGRPSDFSQDIADAICLRLSDGESLRTICASEDMPGRTTVFRWLAEHETFRNQYAYARDAQADVLAEETLEIADDSSGDTYTDEDGNERTNHEVVARSRLRVDARKWFASKVAPKKYGDKVTQEISGPDGKPIETRELSETEAARRIAFTLAKATQ